MKQKSIKFSIAAFGCFLALSFIYFGVMYVSKVSSQDSIKKDPEKANSQKRKITNQFVSEPEWSQPIEISKLAAESNAIVVGIPVSNYGNYSQDKYIVETVYTFQVNEAIKGDLKAGETTKVKLPGGLVIQGSNTMLHITAAGYKKLVNNSKYLIFLKKKNNTDYAPTNGPQGIFEIIDENSAISYGNFANKEVKDKEKKINLVDLFKKVRKFGDKSNSAELK